MLFTRPQLFKGVIDMYNRPFYSCGLSIQGLWMYVRLRLTFFLYKPHSFHNANFA